MIRDGAVYDLSIDDDKYPSVITPSYSLLPLNNAAVLGVDPL